MIQSVNLSKLLDSPNIWNVKVVILVVIDIFVTYVTIIAFDQALRNVTFLAVVCDYGYRHIPKNVSKENMQNFEDYCKSVHAVFLSPPTDDPEELFQFNKESGLIESVSTEDLPGLANLLDNNRALVGFLR